LLFSVCLISGALPSRPIRITLFTDMMFIF